MTVSSWRIRFFKHGSEWIDREKRCSGRFRISCASIKIIDGVQLKRDAEQFVAALSRMQLSTRRILTAIGGLPRRNLIFGIASEEEIQFGDLYMLHALMINHEAEGLKIEIWWEELKHEDNNNQRVMFFHLYN